ncbi:MAG: 50S ribosomal protein L10 [Chloroflexi bacterium]|nr:50S ribosomal protein L10 [Chloroflexota bacterium]
MIRRKKEQIVEKIEEWLTHCQLAIVTDYRGMTVSEINQLRRLLTASGVQFRVVKNNLAGIAAERVGKEELKKLLTGPSAIAFSYGEVSEPAKILSDHIRSVKVPLRIRGGLLNNRLLDPSEIVALSLLPSRQVLAGRLVSQMQTPISSLLTVLSANLTGIIRTLQARKQQLEGG